MNVTLANTISFAKNSLNLAKETVVNYGGRAITQLKHLPVTMHEDFRVAYGVTATVTAVALVAGQYLANKIFKLTKSSVAANLTFGATLASAYAGLSYTTGFPQTKTVSTLIVISLTALRCLRTYSSQKPKRVETLTVSSQKPRHVETLLPINISSYETLREKIRKKTPILCVTDRTGTQIEKLLGVLRAGGSKKAIQIAKGRALILPNMDVDPTEDIARRWERMVLEEVKMLTILNRLGLLSPLSEQVSVILTESSNDVIPAYISQTFENLSLKGCFIIDSKNPNSSTWKQGTHFLFQSEKERLNEKNWDSVFDSLLTDIEKICLYGIPTGSDSLNIAMTLLTN